jgi:TRAP-type C4-dicarboxylate transport system permease large subunit
VSGYHGCGLGDPDLHAHFFAHHPLHGMFQHLGIVMIIACEIGTETPPVGLIIFIVFPDLVLWLPNLLN